MYAMAQNSRVGVVVVTSNHREVVGALLRGFERSEEPVSITIVDQASSDGTSSWLRETFPSVMGFRNFHDVGTARALNQGVAFTLSKWTATDFPFRYVVFTTPDAVWQESAIATCTRIMDSDRTVMAVCPLVLQRTMIDSDSEDDLLSDRIVSAGAERTLARRIRDRKNGELLDALPEIEEIYCGSRRAIVVRASVFTECDEGDKHWFNVRFPNEVVDTDFFWRMQSRGLKTVCASNARVSVRALSELKQRTKRSEQDDARGWRLLMWKNERLSIRWKNGFSMLWAIIKDWLRGIIHPSRWKGVAIAWFERWSITRRKKTKSDTITT